MMIQAGALNATDFNLIREMMLHFVVQNWSTYILLIKVIRLAFALFFYCSFIAVINFLLSASHVYFWFSVDYRKPWSHRNHPSTHHGKGFGHQRHGPVRVRSSESFQFAPVIY